MKRFFPVIVVLLLLAVLCLGAGSRLRYASSYSPRAAVQAVEKVSGYCQRGGQKVLTQGQTSTTTVQKTYPACTVTVYQTGTATLQTLYASRALAAKTNPFTADSNGYWEFYAVANDRIDIQFSGGTSPNNITTPFYFVTDFRIPGSGLAFQNQGTDLTPARNKINLELPFLVGSDDPGNSVTKLNLRRTPTGVYNAITDLGMSGDARYYDITSAPLPGATSVVLLTPGQNEEITSPYAPKTKANPLHTFRVGQGIRIPSGVSSGVDLIATITAISGNTLTFTPATTNAGGYTWVQHDDTAALQTFLGTTVKKGVIQFPEGNYPISSFHNYTAGKDYAVNLPSNSEGLHQQWIFNGAGRDLVSITHSGPGHAIKLAGTFTVNLEVRDLSIIHASQTGAFSLSLTDAGAGLYLQSDQFIAGAPPITQSGATRILVENSNLFGWRYGVLSDNLQSSTIKGNSFYYNANPIALIGTGSQRGLGATTEPNANLIEDNLIQYSPNMEGQRRSSIGAVTSGSKTITCAGCNFTSADLYRIVRVAAASVSSTNHFAIITGITSSSVATMSQPVYTTAAATTVTLYPTSLAIIYLQNSNLVSVKSGTWQGNRTVNIGSGNASGECYTILAENSEQLAIDDVWVEDNSCNMGDLLPLSNSDSIVAGIRLNNSHSVRISGTGFGHGSEAGSGAGLLLDGSSGVLMTNSYVNVTGGSLGFVQINGSKGLKLENTSIFSARGLTNDFVPPDWGSANFTNSEPAELSAGVRFIGGSVADDYSRATEMLNDSRMETNLLVNGNFWHPANFSGWTQNVPAALTQVNGGNNRYDRYVQVATDIGGSGASALTVMSQSVSIPDTIPTGSNLTLAFSYYLHDRGTGLATAPFSAISVKLAYTGGSTYQYEINPSTVFRTPTGRWIRAQIVTPVPSGTSRSATASVLSYDGANRAIFRVTDFRLAYGKRPDFSNDEPITQIKGGRIESSGSLVLGALAGGGNQSLGVNNAGTVVVDGTATSTVISATAYGAVCDNVANDTTAIQNAINDGRTLKKKVLLPAGTCRVTQLTLGAFDNIEGAGIDKTLIKGTANNAIFTVPTQADYSRLAQLTIQGDVALASQVGLDLDGNADYPGFVLHDVYIKDTGSHGLSLGDRPFSVDFNNIHVSNNVGYPILIDTPYAPGIVFRNTYVHVINAASPKVGIRVKHGRVRFENANGLDNAPPIAGTRWAVIGKRNGVDGETTDADAYVVWVKTNFEQFESVGVEHYFNSKSTFEDCTFSYGGANVNRIAIKYDIDTASGYTYAAYHNKGVIDDKSTFGNLESDYKNASYIHATGLPPLMTSGQGPAAIAVAYDNVNQYYDTTLSQRVPLMRSDGFEQPITVTSSTSLIRPSYGVIFTNCSAPCTLTLPNPLWYKTTRELVIRDISNSAATNPVTLQVDGGATIDGAGTYTLNANNGTVRLLPRLTSTDWKTVASTGGGGGVTAVTASTPLGSSGGPTPNISIIGTIPVTSGGTGQIALTSNGVLYGMGTLGIGQTAAGAVNSVLASAGAAPSFTTAPVVSSASLVSNTNQIALGTGNTTTVTMAALTGARIFTLPDADSNPVQPSAAVSNQFLTGISAAGVISRAQPSAANLSNGVTGSGVVVLATSPILITPTIADFTNAIHTHQSTPQGGSLDTAALGSGTLPRARGGTGTSAATTDGQLLIGNTATGNWTVNTLTAGSNITITPGSGTITISASTVAGTNWNNLANPTASLSLAMGTNSTTFNYATGTGANNLFNFTTDASANGTGYLFNIATGASATVKPFRTCAGGTINCFQMGVGGELVQTGSVGAGGTVEFYSENLSSAGNARYISYNNAGNATGLTTFGSAYGGTTAGISNNSLSYLAGTNTLLINTETANPIVFGVNTVEVARLLTGGIFDVATGYRIGGAAVSGNVLRGNGTNFVSAQLNFTDLTGNPTAAGSSTQIQYNNVGELAGQANFTTDGTLLTLQTTSTTTETGQNLLTLSRPTRTTDGRSDSPFLRWIATMKNGASTYTSTWRAYVDATSVLGADTFWTLDFADPFSSPVTKPFKVSEYGDVTATGSFTAGSGTVAITDTVGNLRLPIAAAAITGGATTNVLYNNGGVLGEYTVTGSGSVVMGTSPASITGVTTFSLDAPGSFNLRLVPGTMLTADRTLTLTTGDANRMLSILGNLLIDAAFTLSGGSSTTLNVTGPTSITLPTTGTIATLAGTETFTNKTLTNPIIANIAPGANFTLTQNSVAPFTSVNAGAVANTLYLDSGKVGINTASFGNLSLGVPPTLTVKASGGSDIGIINMYRPTNSLGNGVGLAVSLNNASGTKIEYAYYNGYIVSNTAGAEAGGMYFSTATAGALTPKLYILDSGYIGIGTANPSAQLHTTGSVRFAIFGAGTATFDASGNVSSVSDERLKVVQGDYKEGLAALGNVQPILYKWNEKSGMETEHVYAGFSAQNVKAALPYGTGRDARGYYSLQDRALLAAAINAIKELEAKIQILEAKIR